MTTGTNTAYEDVLWSADERETDDQQDARSRKALDYVCRDPAPCS